MTRLIASVDEAKNRRIDPPVEPSTDSVGSGIIRVDPPDEFGSSVPELPPYVFGEPVLPPAVNGLESYDDETLGDAILEVVDVEGPVPREFVHRRITYATGLKRTGNRIRERLDQIIQRLAERQSVRLRDEFLWPAAMTEPPLRSRANLEQGDRKPELISPEELDRIILHVVEGSFTISSTETARMVILSLGWQRLGQNLHAAIASRVRVLLESGKLNEQNGKLTR